MATEYKITYTYTGQGNTSGNRSVALSRFKKSGDTTRTIGQIKSITYEHWHTSTKTADWALRGRLVLSDNTMFVSDTVTHRIPGDTVKYINTFSGDNLPTAEQFAKLTAVQTLDSQGKTTADGYYAKLYWRANSSYPMRLVVTFVEEPPVVYSPEITTFDVTRCNADYVPDDEGEHAVTSLKLALGNAAGVDAAQFRIYYAANAYPVVGESEYFDLTSRLPELLTGVTNDATILPGEWSAGATWYFAAVFIAGDENDVETSDMPRTLANLHISGRPNGGVCVCGYSQGTEENPMFETYAPGFFYGGIAKVNDCTNSQRALGIQAGSTEGISVSADSYSDTTVTFPQPFKEGTSPIVVVGFWTASTGASHGQLAVAAYTTTNKTCVIRIFNGSSSTRSPAIRWIAVGEME